MRIIFIRKKVPRLFPDFQQFLSIFPDFSRFSPTFSNKAHFSRFSRFSLTAENPVPFRGHEYDTKHHAEVGEQSINSVGLFINLLNFQISRSDNILKKHLSTAAKILYVSSNTKSVNRMCWESHI